MLTFKLTSLLSLFDLAHTTNVFESLHNVPRGWVQVKAASGDESIKLRLSLKQQNLATFYSKLLAVSTPDHQQYGKHYSGHELRSLLQPTDEASNTTVFWLQDNDITNVNHEGEYILFSTTVAKANTLLGTTFNWYTNPVTSKPILRTLSYSVPAEVAPHINFVQPTTRFSSIQPRYSRSQIKYPANMSPAKWAATQVNASCASMVTPTCLLDLYNMHYKADPNNGNTVGYASFLDEYARDADTVQFAQALAPYAIGQSFNVVQLNGGLNDQNSANDSGEANLDNQYIIAISSPTPVTEFSVGGRGPLIPDGDQPDPATAQNEPYLDFLISLMALPNDKIPNVLSISYGENEQEIPPAYAIQVCNMFAQLGARGKTVVFASGDSGVGSFCLTNDGSNRTTFNSQFPSSCPYVTAVGGTTSVDPEEGVFFSSGGFSDLWARPAYQEAAVTSYLSKLGEKNKGLFNPSGRAFPDVSAQSNNFTIVDKGIMGFVSGTSAAAPVFAGVVAMLNSARISQGMPPMGFINPVRIHSPLLLRPQMVKAVKLTSRIVALLQWYFSNERHHDWRINRLQRSDTLQR
ncbi:polynucleotide 3'-phosphatase [Cadophora gregata]|uniref:polynucleotide 3'-phosphatase n=1 Tax=Cadophora gregata TaxID=51156 RepID=UPI0026DD9B71|nr:polynucleotide 3'-phosphatase [Cadophora gregata]KAK0107192.1 polynucleotide 3'-phosphatase [Cadophora gregata]